MNANFLILIAAVITVPVVWVSSALGLGNTSEPEYSYTAPTSIQCKTDTTSFTMEFKNQDRNLLIDNKYWTKLDLHNQWVEPANTCPDEDASYDAYLCHEEYHEYYLPKMHKQYQDSVTDKRRLYHNKGYAYLLNDDSTVWVRNIKQGTTTLANCQY